ncbi:hypothetical protein [Paucibacter sp. M5-1]|uniref:hypothetical protein n=1 Tax=Paucibacter sp. M5-1 TaxID=3015998 RepID=UPI0022B8694E|nr:hypothetical protein [Paucibacter sp. M5-1]MCZ7884602.1 hypothetical protein [Paucibacter sp. M5-1]
MTQHTSLFSLAMSLSLLLAAAAAGAAPASADSTSSAQSRYRAERAVCLEGRSSQSRETCLKEAGAALAEARRAQPGTQVHPDYLANALARCERVPAAERADCERLVRGQGSSSGSVTEGAIVRQLITKSVAPAASAASAP